MEQPPSFSLFCYLLHWLPAAQASILPDQQSERKEHLSSTGLGVILRQTSNWLGADHMLIPAPITVAGGIRSPDWLALGDVPSYLSSTEPPRLSVGVR